jgi:hypothetical protein
LRAFETSKCKAPASQTSIPNAISKPEKYQTTPETLSMVTFFIRNIQFFSILFIDHKKHYKLFHGKNKWPHEGAI